MSSFLQRYSEFSGYSTAGLLRIMHEENGISSIIAVDRFHDLFKFSAVAAKTELTTGGDEREAKPGDSTSENFFSVFFTRVIEHGYRVSDAEEFRLRLRPLVEGDNGSADTPAGPRGKFGAMKVLELYRPTKPFRDMLGGAVIGEYGDCLTAAEVCKC